MCEDMTRIDMAVDKDALDDMMRRGDIKTRKELLNNALTLLKWTIKQRKTGRIIGSIDKTDGRPETYRELSMPILDNIKKVS